MRKSKFSKCISVVYCVMGSRHELCALVTCLGGWGLYNDQTTTSVTHTNNIIYETEDACYHDHEGYNVTLANNIFVKLGSTVAPHSDGTLRSASPTNKPGQRWHAAFNLRVCGTGHQHIHRNSIASATRTSLTSQSNFQYAGQYHYINRSSATLYCRKRFAVGALDFRRQSLLGRRGECRLQALSV